MSFDLILPFLRPIEPLIKDDSISEIMINGSRQVFIEKMGTLEEVTAPGLSEKSLMVVIFQVNRPPIVPSKVANQPDWPEAQQDDLFFDSQEQENPSLPPDPHLQEVIAAYKRETNNQWRPSDVMAYEKVKHVPPDKIILSIIFAKARAASGPNSFSYFIKEILDQANPSSQSRISRKHALKKNVDRIRSLNVGAHNYTAIDFIEDVKIACAREGVLFDNDLFNDLAR
jgi:hypothetical protein